VAQVDKSCTDNISLASHATTAIHYILKMLQALPQLSNHPEYKTSVGNVSRTMVMSERLPAWPFQGKFYGAH
jgi:hypothetical protein